MANIGDRTLVQSVLNADIGGTNASSVRINLADYERVLFNVQVGHCDGVAGTFSGWNAADQLDELCVMQATAATGGTTPKAVSGLDLKQTAANTAGDTFQLEVRSENLDTENGFKYAYIYVAENDDTGTDFVHVTAVADGARYANDNESGVDGTI